MRRLLALLPLAALGCTDTTVSGDFTGLNLYVAWRSTLDLRSLHIDGRYPDGSAALTRDVPLMAPSVPSELRQELYVVLLEAANSGRALAVQVDGLDAAAERIATGTVGVTLQVGELLNAKTALRPPSTCGNGRVETSEACDDGNLDDGDGCAKLCTVEAQFACASEPSVCFPELGTVFVDAAARPCGDGSRARPLCDLASAISAPRAATIVVKSGVYSGPVVIDGLRLELYGERGVVVESASSPALLVRGAAIATVSDMIIRGTTTGGGVRAEGAQTRLRLRRMQLGPGSGWGVESAGGAQLSVERSTVRGQSAGALLLGASAPYNLENSVLADNGGTSTAAAVRITAAPAGSRFVNMTVTANSGGVECAEPAELVNSIVWMSGLVPTSTGCRARYSALGPFADAPPPLGTNFAQDPLLGADYHLGAGSPCVDRGDPSGAEPAGVAPREDFDGQPRPAGQGVDVGADESR